MRNSAALEIRRYLAKQPAKARRFLARIRSTVRSAAPRATEHFSYGIPGFKFNGRPLVWYAGWKSHASLYPITAGMKRAHAVELKGYKTSNGTVRFPLDKPVPAGLVKRFVQTRMAEIRSGAR